MRLRDRIRIRFGMFWPSSRPAVPWRETFYLFLILLGYGVVCELDYRDEVIREAQAQAEAHRITAERALDCINGKSPLGSIDRPKRSANDFGKTVVVCKTEELDV
jgi:hypothetical protein